jgi:hypothetical protein
MLLAGIIYYFNNYKIPKISKIVEMDVRKEIDASAMPKRKVAVVTGEEGITRYTELTDKIIGEKIKIIEMPEKFIVKGSISDIGEIKGKITKEELRFGEQIVSDSLSKDKKWYGEFERLKEYKVSSIVEEEVKTGNIIDVLVNYGNGDYDVVIPKIKVIKLAEAKKISDGVSKDSDKGDNTVSSTDSYNISPLNSGYTLILAVDEEQYRDMEMAKKLGAIETRLYIDENQPPSKKTFDCLSAALKLKIP